MVVQRITPRLPIECTSSGAMAILAPLGDLDLRTQESLQAAIELALAELPLLLAIDLRQVTFIDGATLGVLVAAARRCAAESRRLLLVGPGPRVSRVLAAGGLESHFDVVVGLDRIPGGELTGALDLAAA